MPPPPTQARPPALRGLRFNGRTYLDAVDVADLLRIRARAYRRRADDLVDAAVDPASPVAPDRPVDGAPVAVVDEALACRMVAEELEQRADQLDP